MSIISIIIGLIIWFVIPILTNDMLKRNAHKRAVAMLCKIVGAAIIVITIINYISTLFL